MPVTKFELLHSLLRRNGVAFALNEEKSRRKRSAVSIMVLGVHLEGGNFLFVQTLVIPLDARPGIAKWVYGYLVTTNGEYNDVFT